MEVKHRAYIFSVRVIRATSDIVWKNSAGTVIVKQLIRCATSIGANIVEGQAGSSRKDFANYLNIALKSANETKYWLCLLRDCHLVDKCKIEILLKEVQEIANILGASLKTVREKYRVY